MAPQLPFTRSEIMNAKTLLVIWAPKADITAHELALATPLLLWMKGVQGVLWDDMPLFADLPPHVLRHLSVSQAKGEQRQAQPFPQELLHREQSDDLGTPDPTREHAPAHRVERLRSEN